MGRAETGQRGEAAAARFYQKQGAELLGHNYHTRMGEIDLILREPDGTLVFCEVKTRLSEKFGTPAEAVERHKQRRYIDIARYFLMKLGRDDVNVRFDVLEVFADAINHIENAFGA